MYSSAGTRRGELRFTAKTIIAVYSLRITAESPFKLGGCGLFGAANHQKVCYSQIEPQPQPTSLSRDFFMLSESGFVYIVRPVGSSMIYKIGSTTDLNRRMISLQNKIKGVRLEYIVQMRVTHFRFHEDRLHIKYQNHHLGGDWFSLPDSEIATIINYLKSNQP